MKKLLGTLQRFLRKGKIKTLGNYWVRNKIKYHLKYICFNYIVKLNNLENWTQAIYGKRGKVEVLVCKVLICGPVIHKKLLLNFFSTFFHDQRWHLSQFTAYSPFSISKELKELNEVVPGKGLFASIKGQLCFINVHLRYQDGNNIDIIHILVFSGHIRNMPAKMLL